MLHSRCFIFICLLCLCFIGISKAHESFGNVDVAISDDIAQNVMDFGLNLMQKMSTEYDKVVIFSPLSIMSALAMLLLGAKGRSYSELAPLFGQLDMVKLHEQFGLMIRDAEQSFMATTSPLRQLDPWHSDGVDMSLRSYPVNQVGSQTITLANGLFVQQGFSINPSYRLDINLVNLHYILFNCQLILNAVKLLIKSTNPMCILSILRGIRTERNKQSIHGWSSRQRVRSKKSYRMTSIAIHRLSWRIHCTSRQCGKLTSLRDKLKDAISIRMELTPIQCCPLKV